MFCIKSLPVADDHQDQEPPTYVTLYGWACYALHGDPQVNPKIFDSIVLERSPIPEDPQDTSAPRANPARWRLACNPNQPERVYFEPQDIILVPIYCHQRGTNGIAWNFVSEEEASALVSQFEALAGPCPETTWIEQRELDLTEAPVVMTMEWPSANDTEGVVERVQRLFQEYIDEIVESIRANHPEMYF